MATGKTYYYYKQRTGFMHGDIVRYLMSLDKGAYYVVLYEMIIHAAMNHGGRLESVMGEIVVPFDMSRIKSECLFFDVKTIKKGLDLFKRLGLMYCDDGVWVICNFEKLVGSETSYKAQKSAQRAKSRPRLRVCKRVNESCVKLPSGQIIHVDEELYGGNGMLAYDLAGGVCEMCGSEEGLSIYSTDADSNESESLYILCKNCAEEAASVFTPNDWLRHNWNPSDVRGEQRGGHVHPPVHPEIEKEIEAEPTAEVPANTNTPFPSPTEVAHAIDDAVAEYRRSTDNVVALPVNPTQTGNDAGEGNHQQVNKTSSRLSSSLSNTVYKERYNNDNSNINDDIEQAIQYAKDNLHVFTKKHEDELRGICLSRSPGLVVYAVDQMAKYGKDNYGYLWRTLKAYIRSGYKTAEQAMAWDDKRDLAGVLCPNSDKNQMAKYM